VTIAPHEDAYGAILLAALEGRDASEVMERDDGTVWCGDGSDYLHPPRRWPPTERRMLRFARGRVLDVGCAAGRVSLLLQERGREVVAIDESPLAVEVARRRGVRDARALSLADVDASLGLFDTVLIVRNNMGLGGPGGAAELLDRLAAITTPRGRLITDSVDPGRIDDAAIRAGTAAGTAGVFGQRLRVRHMAFASPWFHYVMTSPDAFAALVEDSPWRIARIVDDGAPRYGVVLEKRRRR
jgi:SAM-dependent methyltransferase